MNRDQPPARPFLPLKPSQEEVDAFCRAANDNEEDIVVEHIAKYGKTIVDELCAPVGDTALAWAAWAGHENIVDILLKAGADPDKKCRGGNTALLWAVVRQQKETTLQLLRADAKMDITDSSGQTALELAETRGYHEIAEVLKHENRVERKRREEEARLAEEQRQALLRAEKEAADARFEKLKQSRPQKPAFKKNFSHRP